MSDDASAQETPLASDVAAELLETIRSVASKTRSARNQERFCKVFRQAVESKKIQADLSVWDSVAKELKKCDNDMTKAVEKDKYKGGKPATKKSTPMRRSITQVCLLPSILIDYLYYLKHIET